MSVPNDVAPDGRERSILVYCGSNPGARPEYLQAARALGAAAAKRGYGIVYGGASIGLMGAVADAALEAGGTVVGVMPRALVAKEIAHKGLTELIETSTMHERKTMMAARASAFVALPGGAGTLEELFEAWTWAMLGFHDKPCALLNVAGYYDKLLEFIASTADEGFIKRPHVDMLIVEREIDPLIDRLEAYRPPSIAKWVGRD